MTELLEASIAYAARGWRVFPVHGIVNGRCSCRRACSSPGKHPLVRRGLHEASTDPRGIKEWWTRWPFANIAVATGDVVVIDVDGPEGEASITRLEGLGFRLSPTLTAITGRGRHLYFACDRDLPNTTRRLPGVDEDLPGIDLRADGGYVVAPPSQHANGKTYCWLEPGVDLAPLPSWIKASERRVALAPPIRTPAFTLKGTPYGLAALREEIDVLARTPEGGRNDQLNRSAFALGQLIAGGELNEASTRSELQTAAHRIGLCWNERHRTIESGLRSGQQEPRSTSLT